MLAFVMIGVFVFPIPKPSFRVTYNRVTPSVVDTLESFRRRNSFKLLKTRGAVWRYYDVGSGPGTILFLHGMGGSGDIWFQQVEALQERFRCIVPSYPPVGSLEQLRAGVLGILKQEGIERADLVGSSMGGYLAQFMLASDPDRIRKAVLGNTFPPNPMIPQRARMGVKYLPWIPEWALMLGLRRNADRVLFRTSGGSELVRAYLHEQTCGFIRKPDFIARCACLTQGFTPPALSAERQNAVLIVESDNDPLVESSLREMLRRTYPGATVKTFRQAGHFPYLCRADEYNRVIAEFISL
jgi:pimeloyl-ACP methyl ester carboxylesterase